MSDNEFFREAAPGELTGPRKVQDACWVAWQSAERREHRLVETNRQLTDEVRVLDRRCTTLHVQQQTMRTRNILGTISIALASIFGGTLATATYAEASNGMLIVLGIVTGVFLVGGAAVPWLRHGSHSAVTPPTSSPFGTPLGAQDDLPED